MKSIGIKLADGSFYPVMKDGSVEKKALDVTTVQDNQTKVQIDLYRSETDSMEDAEYVDTLEITNLKPHPNGIPSLHLNLSVDENNHLQAEVRDPETGTSSSTNVTLVSRSELERSEPVNFSIDTTTADALSDIDAVDSVLKNGMSNPTSILKDSEGNSILDTSTFTLTEEKPETEIFASAEDLKAFAQDTSAATFLKDSEGNSILDTSTFTLTEEKPEKEIFATAEDMNFVAQDDSTNAGSDDSFSDDDFDFELPNLESILKSKGDAENANSMIARSVAQDSEGEDTAVQEETEETVVQDGSYAQSKDVSVSEPDFTSAENSVSIDVDFPTFTPPESSPELTPKTPVEPVVTAAIPDLDLSDFGLPNFDDADEYPSAKESGSFTQEGFASEPETEPFAATQEKASFAQKESAPSQTDEASQAPSPHARAEAKSEKSFADLDSSAVLAAGTKDVYDLPDFSGLEPTGIEDVDITSALSPATQTESTLVQDEDFPEPKVYDFDEAVKSIPDSADTVAALPDFDDPSLALESNANEGTEFTVPDFEYDTPEGQNSYDDSGDKQVSNYDLFDEAEESSSINSYAPQSNMFEGLYDKETLNGNSSGGSYYDDEREGGSALPVIVCVICSIICILGALLVLFVIPSKINIFNKNTETHIAQAEADAGTKSSEQAQSGQVQSAPAEPDAAESKAASSSSSAESADQTHNAAEPLPPPQKKDASQDPSSTDQKQEAKAATATAKENEIVVAATPQQVVPEPPVRTSAKTPDIRYTVVWGDTLWDISNAYYKTPWRYQHIADHNHIKNPNYIQTGSVLLIPSD